MKRAYVNPEVEIIMVGKDVIQTSGTDPEEIDPNVVQDPTGTHDDDFDF